MSEAVQRGAGRQAIGDGARRRAFWLKQLHQWHWVSAAICLIGMLLFALTGITLNHAAQIEARPRVEEQQAKLPETLLALIEPSTTEEMASRPVPPAIGDWVAARMAVRIQGRPAEWSDSEIYIALPMPGGDAWLSISRDDGEVIHERTDRGWISYLNDLHKGRNTGTAWSWFLDIFAAACLVFCATGLFLLQFHARNRPATWPMVGLGLVVPVILAMLFIH